MTTAAIFATREVSWRPSFYRGEQYDSDLGLYDLRARYYNPATGRFLSRDPKDGKAKIPATLHRYLYAIGDPANHVDPKGRESMLETGSLDEIIGTTPVPAIVEMVGNFVQLQLIPFTLDAAEVVAAYAEDAAEVIKSNGLMKWYVCMQLGTIYASAIDDVIDSDGTDAVKNMEEDKLSELTQKACAMFVFHDFD
jgi:RHS repeat-associated protein